MATTSPSLKAALDGKLCSGCGLCAGIAPEAVALELAAPGFLRPRQSAPLSPEQEHAVAQSCPGLKAAPWTLTGAPHAHFAWGPYLRIMTGNAIDPEVRFTGSSGGFISALSRFALASGKVDAIVTIKAGPETAPLANPVQVIDDPEELIEAAGSRYGPSAPLADIGRLLEDGRRFLFVGKPCDVSALRQLGTIDSRVGKSFPIALSFFCGGVPSLSGTNQVIRAMGIEPAEVTRFRYRGNGWPGRARAETASGQVGEMSYEDSWGGYLSKHVQFRRKICPDAVGGVADVACADAWFGGETGYPQFEDREGRSLVMVRTEAGAAFLDDALTAGAVECEPSSIADVDLMQPSQRNRKTFVRSRRAALQALLKPHPDFAGVMVRDAARYAPIRDQLRNFVGTALRIMKGRQ